MSTGPFRPHRLLVPYDFGPAGDRTLRVARALSPQHLHVAHVLPAPGPLAWGEDARLHEAQERLKAALAGTGLERATRHVLTGDPGPVLAELAAKLECDQVVLVAPPGSAVAEEVLRGAPCTVLVVRF